MLKDYRLNEYHLFDELESILKDFEAEYPGLIKLESIGKSFRDRDIYALTVTDFSTGNPDEKPGFYVDACTHAEEFVGCNVILYMLKELTEGFGNKSDITKLLKHNVFYVIPRLNPDGIEFAMQGHPWCGNGRYLPSESQPKDGFFWEDLNNDGIIAQIRVEDKDGEWKISEKNHRIMVLRKPWETEGKFYRLYPEGYIRGEITGAPLPKPRDGNINRNYPVLWTPDGMQYGAGEYPMSEPETEAAVKYILAHKNIGGMMSFHTNAGVILRPFNNQSDKFYKGQDLKLFKQLGEIGTEELGYPVVSVFEEFTPEAEGVRGGVLTDWTYLGLGIPGLVTELWNVFETSGCGISDPYPPDYLGEDADIKILEWAEKHLGDRAYVDWQPFDHPQLGKVEIGGWNKIRVYRNPPEDYVEELSKKAAAFTIKLAKTLPQLEIKDESIEKLSDNLYKVEATIRNTGFMPTYLSAQAIEVKTVEPLKLSLKSTNSEDISIICASNKDHINHLEGRFGRDCEWSQWILPWNATEQKVSWVIKSNRSPALEITVGNDRAGTVRKQLSI